jgi:trehalose-6-phosphate synthase
LARLIVVSNRAAVPSRDGGNLAGGLAVAVRSLLKRHEGLWFGWSGTVSSDEDIATIPRVRPNRAHRRFPIGIETIEFARLAQHSVHSPLVHSVLGSLAGRAMMIGVDRLDYSKGLRAWVPSSGSSPFILIGAAR